MVLAMQDARGTSEWRISGRLICMCGPKKGKTPKRIANGRLPCSGDTTGVIARTWVLNCALMCMGINLGVLYASHGKRENMPHGFTRSLGMVAKSRRSSPRPLGHLAPCQEKQTGSHGGGQVPRHLAPPAWLGVNTARVPHSSHHHRKRKTNEKNGAPCVFTITMCRVCRGGHVASPTCHTFHPPMARPECLCLRGGGNVASPTCHTYHPPCPDHGGGTKTPPHSTLGCLDKWGSTSTANSWDMQ